MEFEKYQKQFERGLDRFKNDPNISPHNKELVTRFLRDAALGKTVIGRAKKRIGPSRRFSYIKHLRYLMDFSQKDLDSLTQDDMEAFVEALDNDQIRSKARFVHGRGLVPSTRNPSPRYRVDIKISIKKFYKWLWGNSKAYPEIVEWIDTYVEEQEIPALTEAEVEKIVDRSKTTLQRAIIQVLFDGGFRVGELVSIRLCHVRLRNIDPRDASKKYFFVRVPESKTLPRTVVLPMHSSTKWLTLWLEDHPAKPVLQQDGTVGAEDVDAPLFPMSSDAVRTIVKRAGTKALNKRVYPHLLRHTSATYWCNKLPYFKFCKRFGWTMTSKMPQRYIDREGVDEIEIAEIYYEDERAKLLKEKQDLLAQLSEMRVSRREER